VVLAPATCPRCAAIDAVAVVLALPCWRASGSSIRGLQARDTWAAAITIRFNGCGSPCASFFGDCGWLVTEGARVGVVEVRSRKAGMLRSRCRLTLLTSMAAVDLLMSLETGVDSSVVRLGSCSSAR